jgi:hypothetical protein
MDTGANLSSALLDKTKVPQARKGNAMSISTVRDFRFTEIPNLIRGGMRRKNLSPKAVARNLKCHQSAISHWTVGTHLPVEKTRTRLCYILGIKMDTMLQAVKEDHMARKKFLAADLNAWTSDSPIVEVMPIEVKPIEVKMNKSKSMEDGLFELMEVAMTIMTLSIGERLVVQTVVDGLVAARKRK